MRFFYSLNTESLLFLNPLPTQWLAKVIQNDFFARLYCGDYIGQWRSIFLAVAVEDADQGAIGVQATTQAAWDFVDMPSFMQELLDLLLQFLMQLAAGFGRFDHVDKCIRGQGGADKKRRSASITAPAAAGQIAAGYWPRIAACL